MTAAPAHTTPRRRARRPASTTIRTSRATARTRTRTRTMSRAVRLYSLATLVSQPTTPSPSAREDLVEIAPHGSTLGGTRLDARVVF